MNQSSVASLKRDTSNKENFLSPSSANPKAKKRMSAVTPEQMRQLKVATENMSINMQTFEKSKAEVALTEHRKRKERLALAAKLRKDFLDRYHVRQERLKLSRLGTTKAYREYGNFSVLSEFLQDSEDGTFDNKEKCREQQWLCNSILSNIKEDENRKKYINVRYYRTAGIEFSRRYACLPSLQSLSKIIMHKVVQNENLYDIDITNCHIRLFLALCPLSKRIDFPSIRSYGETNSGRENKLRSLMGTTGCTRDEAKELFLRLCNGGSFKRWCSDFKANEAKLPSFVRTFMADVRLARQYVLSLPIARCIRSWWTHQSQKKQLLRAIQKKYFAQKKKIPQALKDLEPKELAQHIDNKVYSGVMFYYEDLCFASFEKTTLGTAKDPSCGHWVMETLKFDAAHIRLLTEGKSNIEGFVEKLKYDCIELTKSRSGETYFDLTGLLDLTCKPLGKPSGGELLVSK